MAKTPHSQYKGFRFNPWSGNQILHAATKSLHATPKTWCSQINKYFKNIFFKNWYQNIKKEVCAKEGAESQGSVQLLNCVRLFAAPNCSTPSFPVHHQLPEFVQTHVHHIGNGECKSQFPLAVDSNQQWRKEKHCSFP